MAARCARAGICLALALVLTLASAAVPAAADPAAAEQAFVSAINDLRATEGLGPVRLDAELTAIARRWAARMADAGAISHNAGFAGQVEQRWQKIGENVGRGPDVAGLMRAFIASPTHRANLVDPAFELVGVGVVERGGELWTSHQLMVLFDEPAAAPPPSPPPPPSPARPTPPPAPPPAPPVPVAAVAPPADWRRVRDAILAVPAAIVGLRGPAPSPQCFLASLRHLTG